MMKFPSRSHLVALCLLSVPIMACGRGGDDGSGGAAPPEDIGPDRNAVVIENDPFGETIEKIVYLDQNWSPRESQRFYFTPQGSQIVPYEWFLALEQPDSEELFRDNQNMLRFRFLPQRPDAMNPDGLPVGLTRDEGRDRRWLGLTCAACHANQIDYEEVGYRIDGAPTLADVPSFLLTLTEALKQTRSDDNTFDRFAARVLGDNDTPERRETLGRQLDIVIDRREGYNARNFPPDAPAGFARVDAFGAILNEVFHRAVRRGDDTPPTANTEPADAPTSYPFLWDTPHHDKVQWIGNAENGGTLNIGALGRNVGEVLGVFADFEIPENPGPLGYSSSVEVLNLHRMEEWVRTLRSPQWPAGFPPIDEAKRAAGEVLYQKHCLDCHRSIDRTDPNRAIRAILVDVETDPRTSDNFWHRTGETGKLEDALVKVFNPFGGRFGPVATGAAILDNAVIGTIVGSPFEAPRDVLTEIEFGERAVAFALAPDPAEVGGVYKARPLNGIWATAPYLHNGSVPNLYQLLLPADERVRSFSVGSRQFDPEHVGFRTDAPGFFQFRTHDDDGEPIPGNSNAGHEFGTDLTDEQRWQLVEYLKAL